MEVGEQKTTTLSRGLSSDDLPPRPAAGDLRTLVAACASVSGEQLVTREATSSPEIAGRNEALENYNKLADHVETCYKAKVDVKTKEVTSRTSKPLSELEWITFSESRPCSEGLMQLREAFQPYLGAFTQEMKQSDGIHGEQRTREESSSAGAMQCAGDAGVLYAYISDGQEPGERKGMDGSIVTCERNRWSPPDHINGKNGTNNAAENKKDTRSYLLTNELALRTARVKAKILDERQEESVQVHSFAGPAATSSEDLDADMGERPRKRKAMQEVLQKVPEMRVLIEKLLTISDTDKRGCIALPKGPVEEHLPPLDKKEGVELPCEDITGHEWKFQFRFWTLKHHRTYILQHTLDYVRAHKIVAGDTLQLCRAASGKLVIKVRRGKSPGGGRPLLGKWGGHKMGSAHKFGTLQLSQKALTDHSNLGRSEDGEGERSLMIEMSSSKGSEQRDGDIARKDAGVLVKGFLAGKRKVDTGGDSFFERGWSSVQKRSPHQKRKLWGMKGAEMCLDVNATDSNAGCTDKSSGSGGNARHEGGMAISDVLHGIDQQKRTGNMVSGSEDTDEDWQPDGQKSAVRKARRAMSAGRPRRNIVPMQWLMSDYDTCEKQSRKRKTVGDLDVEGATAASGDVLRGKEIDVCNREHQGGCDTEGRWQDMDVKQTTDQGSFCKKNKKKGSEESQRPRLVLEQCCAWKIVGQPGCPEKAASGSAYCWEHMPPKHQKQGGEALISSDVPKKMNGKQKRGARIPRGLLVVPWHGREASKLVAKALGRARKERAVDSTEQGRINENGEAEYDASIGADNGKIQLEVGPLIVPDKPIERELLCNKGNGGKTWRCGRKRIPGRVFCEVHAKNLKKGCDQDKPSRAVKDGGTGGKHGGRKVVDVREMNMELPPEGQRCNKSNGAKSWRCSRFRLPGRAFCEVHCTFPKSDRSERRMRYGPKALATVPAGYITDSCMGGLDGGEILQASVEHLPHLPLASAPRECAFVGGNRPCPLPAEPGHLACARHMKPGMMRHARLLKKAKYSSHPCKDDGRGNGEEEVGILRLEGPANMSQSTPELTLARPDATNMRWWTTAPIPDSMVALAHAASQASIEDAVLKAGSHSGGSGNAVADEQGPIIALTCSDRGLETLSSRNMLGDFMLGKSNGTVEDNRQQMYGDSRGMRQEGDQEAAWREKNRIDSWIARRGVETGRLSPDEGASVAASAITYSGQELLTDGLVSLSTTGMAGKLDTGKWDVNGSSAPGGESRLAFSLHVERSSLTGSAHTGISSKDINKQLEKRPEMRGLQLSKSALGSVYSRWGNSEDTPVRRLAPSAAWQDRLPERTKETFICPENSSMQPVAVHDGLGKQHQATDPTSDTRSRLPPRKRQGLQLFGVYLQGGNLDEQQQSSITPLLQQSQPPPSSALQDVLRPGESAVGNKTSPPWWLSARGAVGPREPPAPFPAAEPRWLSSSSIHMERENGLLASGSETQVQCAKMDSTFRWRCNIPAMKGFTLCQEHAQEAVAADTSFVRPSFSLSPEAPGNIA